MDSRSDKPSSSKSHPAERRTEHRRRDREKADVGASRPRSRERDRDRNRDRRRDREHDRDRDYNQNHDQDRGYGRDHEWDRDRGERKKKSDSKGKRKEKPLLNGIISDLKEAEAQRRKANKKATFETGEDFIAFVSSDDEKEEEKRKDDDRSHVREWDKGKMGTSDGDWGKDRQRGAQKRKYEYIFDEEELVNGNERLMEMLLPKAPWVSAVDWENCNNVAEMLHREVEAFVEYICPTPVEDEIRSLVVDLVSKAVKEAFPDAKVLPFGSFGTKLYLPLGDIDLVVQSQSMAHKDKVKVLHAIATIVKQAKITSKVTIIAKAKVPIIKFVTIHGRLNVDISINQANGVIASQIVNGFLKDMQSGGNALRSLIMVAKAFLNQRSMNEVYTGGLGSYSIVCLAVSFLQMHPKIRKGEIDAAKNLGVLVIEFFELYGCYFNYEEVGISVRNGGYYFSKRERGWSDYYKTNLLSIEDPTDPTNDISKGSYGIHKVRTTFAGAHGILTAAAYHNAGIIRAQQNDQIFSLRGNHSPDEMTMLSKILGVTQETINHRRLLQEVYNERTLHQLLGVESPKPALAPVDAYSKRSSPRNGSTSKQPSTHNIDGEEDMDIESEDDKYQPREQSDDEGRYSITTRNQRPRKRQKMSTSQNVDTIFTTDDDDDGEDELIINTVTKDGSDPENASGGDAQGRRSAYRRSYWLSKGSRTGEGYYDSN